jgi:hypothetical protein
MSNKLILSYDIPDQTALGEFPEDDVTERAASPRAAA